MPLNIEQILVASAPDVIKLLGKPTYTLGEVYLLPSEEAYRVFMHDSVTGERIPMIWSVGDDDKNDTEEKKIYFVKAFLENAVESLTDLIQHSWHKKQRPGN